MELKEFLNLIKKSPITFVVLFLIVFFTGLLWYDKESKLYQGSVAINISRGDKDLMEDYQYDQFYRLQADEKFGKNVVSWVGDPGLMELSRKDFVRIRKEGWGDISKVKAIQSAPNYVKVQFKSKTQQSAVIFGKILGKNLNKKTQELNIDQDEKNWFKLTANDVYVAKNLVNVYFVLIVSACLGLLLGIFGVLIMHYFSGNENRN
jgi:hypothetical protein